MRCAKCYRDTYHHHACPDCGTRLSTLLSPRMRNQLKREAKTNRRRAILFGFGIIFGICSAPLMAEHNPGGIPWLAVYMGALVAFLLWALGELSPYEDSWHEFHETYINAYHNYAWPVWTGWNLTVGPGITNFVVVELGVVIVAGLMCIVTHGAMDIGCVLICGFAAFIAWFFSSCLKLHWY